MTWVLCMNNNAAVTCGFLNVSCFIITSHTKQQTWERGPWVRGRLARMRCNDQYGIMDEYKNDGKFRMW